jgi:hypothetical protein
MLQNVLTALWAQWKRFGHKIANLQARALLFVFYYSVLGLFAVPARAFSDPLALRTGNGSGWAIRPGPFPDMLTQARRQF